MNKGGRTYIPKCEDMLPLPAGQRPCPRCLLVLATDDPALKKTRRKTKCRQPQPVEPAEAPSPSPEKPAVTRCGGDPSKMVKYRPYNANLADNPMGYVYTARWAAKQRRQAEQEAEARHRPRERGGVLPANQPRVLQQNWPRRRHPDWARAHEASAAHARAILCRPELRFCAKTKF